MGYRFYFGASGAGKTYRAFSDIINESIKNREKRYFIIVPEQFTMQTQKDIVQMHPNHASNNIDVLSFNRLAYRIFEELDIENLTSFATFIRFSTMRFCIGVNPV